MSDSDDNKEKRRRTVPIYPWWTEAVKRELKARGMDQLALSAKIQAAPPEVSRCINLKVPVLELVIAISDELKIPYPAILPESEAEALHLATQRRLIRRDLQLGEITAGVAETTKESQTAPVPSEHAFRSRKTSKKSKSVGASRAK